MDPVVNLTASCGLRGKLVKAAAGTEEKDTYEFFGVPYAEPPVGKLRFAKTEPLPLWDGIRDAKEFGAVCPQDFGLLKVLPFPMPQPEPVSEDCLFLNIYTPSLDSASRLPVMFWIHGGGLNMGFSQMFNGHPLAATKDVVVVTINYRLGSFGFLCTDDSASTGNYGIFDQIEALKWVQQHIAHFGGDADNVTIFGESAGGMSVSLLAVSPLARGLFQRAIAESGTVFGGDIIASPPAKAAANVRASMAKKYPDWPSSTASGQEIVEFLRQQPADDLPSLGDSFYAVIDGNLLPTAPVNIYASAAQNNVDLLVGVNSDDGYMIVMGLATKFGMDLNNLSIAAVQLFIGGFATSLFSYAGNPELVTAAILSQYLNDASSTATSEELLQILTEFITDMLFLVPAIQTANFHSRTSKTFFYNFCYRPAMAWYPQWARADHGIELFFLMDFTGFPSSEEDAEMARMMKSYWVNFAKTGNPNGDGLVVWPEYDETSQEYLTIQLPAKVDAKLKEKRIDFWLRQLPEIISKSTKT